MQMRVRVLSITSTAALLFGMAAQAQMIENTQAPNTAKAGINKSLLDEIGAGRGDVMTAGSSVFLITAIRSGRCAGDVNSSNENSPVCKGRARTRRRGRHQ
jgi:hypothetical protein